MLKFIKCCYCITNEKKEKFMFSEKETSDNLDGNINLDDDVIKKIPDNSIISYVSLNYDKFSAKYSKRNVDDSILDKLKLSYAVENDSNYPYLILEEEEGNSLRGQKLIILKTGLINSPRGLNDGVTIFGCKLKNNNNEFICDYELDFVIKEDVQYYFMLYYNKVDENYYIKPYKDYISNNTTLLFIKIENECYLNKKFYLNISDVYIQIKNTNDNIDISRIVNNNIDKIYSFNKNDSPILIGRHKSCKVRIEDKGLSRVHCVIEYDFNNNNWIIKDGHEGKKSTNGTWICPCYSFQIKDDCLFRLGKSKYKLSIIKS